METKESADLSQPSKDRAPNFGGTVERVRAGRKRSTPIVAQAAFTETGDEYIQFQTNTGGRLKKLQPIEEAGRMASEGRNIDPEVLEKARRQSYAINRKNAPRK